ncbi:MAG: hypothetical protein ACO3U0_04720 [Ilumatobacteraceae bacterium]
MIATQLGTYFGYVFPAVGLPTLPWPLYNGLLGLGLSEGAYFGDDGSIVGQAGVFGQYEMFLNNPTGVFFVGQALHFVNGIVFAILFGLIARHSLPGNSKTNGGNIQKGLLYGVIMTIISAGILVPYAYVQGNGYGFFLFDGPDGWKLPAGILVWHLIYGYFLGALYQPDDD